MRFLPYLEWKFIVIEVPVTFLSLGCLYLGILGLKVNSILARRISAYLIYGDGRGLFRFPEIYFIESCSASTDVLRKELGGH